MKIGFVSLGCSKNLVDTEMMIGLVKKNKFEVVNNEKEAEIIVINTCGFIKEAKQEAIDTILEMASYKQKGNCKILIVTGCLVQRHKKELEESLPEVDRFISINEYEKFGEIIEEIIKVKCNQKELLFLNREITTGTATAYLKISEGCSNYCTYCSIPYIRGQYKSRTMEEILLEVKQLDEKGIKEIIVIAQDTTKYGIDLYGKPMLAELLHKISEFNNIKWVRFLYAYPETLTDEMILEVKNNKKICKYFDIPLQHISNSILKTMNRKTTEENIRKLISKIRKEIPEAQIRTSLIVGFPGETEEDFKNLISFVKEIKFNKLGVFEYSKEEGTPAAKYKNQILKKVKTERHKKIMQLQKQISNNIQKQYIGKELEVLIEKINDKYIIGRSIMDVPDMDGLVYIKNTQNVNIGNFVRCIVVESRDYDLIAEIKK